MYTVFWDTLTLSFLRALKASIKSRPIMVLPGEGSLLTFVYIVTL